MGGNLHQCRNARDYSVVFDTRTHPNISGPLKFSGVFLSDLWPFGENLKCVLRTFFHHGEYALDEIDWHILVEQVAHGVDKDQSRRLPSEGDREGLWMHS
jgi:hypothetical protein